MLKSHTPINLQDLFGAQLYLLCTYLRCSRMQKYLFTNFSKNYSITQFKIYENKLFFRIGTEINWVSDKYFLLFQKKNSRIKNSEHTNIINIFENFWIKHKCLCHQENWWHVKFKENKGRMFHKRLELIKCLGTQG